ncbi:MAG: right-handed parallel beta-helix repeat-containing protein [Deltaproteobacteria bacterium]
MKIREKMGLALLVIGFLGLIVPSLAAAQQPTIKVNCNKGESVQSALDNLTGPATIVVKGTCHENVVIKKDDVTIEGGTFLGPDPNQNTIHVQGARRVLITGATIGGERNGVGLYQGGSVTIERSSIQGNAGVGIAANFGSLAVVNFCKIQSNDSDGVVATANSSLLLIESTITDNGGAGVNVTRGSSARIGANFQGDARPNTIERNRGPGIKVYQASQALIVNNTIQYNIGNGVFIEGASATLPNNTIKFNSKGIEVASAGNARIGINDNGSAGVGNIIESNQLEGISIGNGGTAYMLNNQIRNNGLPTVRAGIGIYRATGRLVGGNTIEGNGTHGVEVNQGTLFQGKGDWNLTPVPDIISQNGYTGIRAWNSASLDISNATIQNNGHNGISVDLHSTLNVDGSTISSNVDHGIWLNQGSAANLGSPPASVKNNLSWGVFCADMESSLAGTTSGVTGNGTNGTKNVNCTGFGPD